jgi:hypothetical protein
VDDLRPPLADAWSSGTSGDQAAEDTEASADPGTGGDDPAPVTPLRGLDGAPYRRPGSLRPVPPAHQRRTGRALSPVAETGEDAEVRPLRPAAADAPALAALPAPVPVEPLAPSDAVIDADDPLGLGRSPLSSPEPEEPVTDAWLADWISGDWAMPTGFAPQEQAPEQRQAPQERLGDEDRALLSKLQSGTGDAPRPRMTRRAGIGGPPAARGPRPPDIAG